MRLGIDFGTTRIVAAAVDRGNYPLVRFENADGDHCDWYPPLVAFRGESRVYGWEAWRAQQESGWIVIRSLKRYLEDAGVETRVEVAGHSAGMLELLTGLMSSLKTALVERSSLNLAVREPLEVVLGVPANANGNQRFLTVEAFRRAGFEVLGLLNEPSAASIEFTHANRGKHPALTEGISRLRLQPHRRPHPVRDCRRGHPHSGWRRFRLGAGRAGDGRGRHFPKRARRAEPGTIVPPP